MTFFAAFLGSLAGFAAVEIWKNYTVKIKRKEEDAKH